MELLITASMNVPPTLPFLVFFAELCVVTISTVRIIFVARGMKVLAPVLGFFEITIWLFAIGQIMQNLSDVGCYLGFAGGFTLGNFLGVLIEKRLAIGNLIVRMVFRQDPGDLIRVLRRVGFSVTNMDGAGGSGPVKIIFTVIPRKELDYVLGLIRTFHPEAFYSVEEVREVSPGFNPAPRAQLAALLPSLLRFRKVRRLVSPELRWQTAGKMTSLEAGYRS